MTMVPDRSRRLAARLLGLLCLAPLLLALAGCAAQGPTRPTDQAMVALVGDPARAREVIVVIPGALTSVRAYGGYPVPPGAAMVGYRFPGIDGRGRERGIRIVEAGAEIAAWVNARPHARVRLVGMSTGGPIALEAARRIRGPRVEVAILSSALPSPATAVSTVVAFTDLAAAAERAGSYRRRDLFAEYHRTLLYGRWHYRTPALAARSARMAEAVKNRLQLPEDGLTRAHGGNLLFWTLQNPQELAHVRVLFLHGLQDPVYPAGALRRLAARLPDAKVILYPLSGHLLLSTERGVYADMNAAFQNWSRP
jgi:pimeloyl-ACP methyl ester carboxylesterase